MEICALGERPPLGETPEKMHAFAVRPDEDKRQFCLDHGAVGVINRNDFSHWGVMPDIAGQK